jgi:hypothetical protein
MDVKSERSSRGPGVRIRISFVWAILLEEHANQLISRDRNNQKNGANHANHEHPAQNMSHNPDNKVEHSTPPNTFGVNPRATSRQRRRRSKTVTTTCTGAENPLAHYFLSRYSPGTSSCGTSCVLTSLPSASPASSTPITTSASNAFPRKRPEPSLPARLGNAD